MTRGDGPDRWETLEAIFHTAAALGPAARGSYLRAACQGRPALERKVRRLLAASDRAHGFIAGLVIREAGEVAEAARRRWPASPEQDRPDGTGPGAEPP